MVNIINELVRIQVASSHVIGPIDLDVDIGMAAVAVTTVGRVTSSVWFMLWIGKGKFEIALVPTITVDPQKSKRDLHFCASRVEFQY